MNRVQDTVLETLADLIRINSVNPNYDGGVPEADLAQYVEGLSHRYGIDQAHTEDECIDCAQVPIASEIDRRFMLEFE